MNHRAINHKTGSQFSFSKWVHKPYYIKIAWEQQLTAAVLHFSKFAKKFLLIISSSHTPQDTLSEQYGKAINWVLTPSSWDFLIHQIFILFSTSQFFHVAKHCVNDIFKKETRRQLRSRFVTWLPAKNKKEENTMVNFESGNVERIQ